MHSGLSLVDALEAAVRDALGSKVSKDAHKLARDCFAVLCGIRTAMLVDMVYITPVEARRLSIALQRISEPQRYLSLVYESNSATTFVINLETFRKRKTERDPIFVQLGGRVPMILKDRPLFLTPLLDQLVQPSHETSSLIELNLDSNRVHHLVTLSGYLLDYASAYVLKEDEPDSTTCLNKTNLVLVNAKWSVFDDNKGHLRDSVVHDLMSFSYPESLVEQSKSNVQLAETLDPDLVCDALRTRLSGRSSLASQRLDVNIVCSVDHEIVSLDRVAL
ncbi:hypothetical protein ACM66B_003403 [Microbotryomycetes sp. NB124-2]